MAISSQPGSVSSMGDYFGDKLEVPTVAEDWSDIFSPSNPFLQVPVGPLDPELAAIDSLLSSDDFQSLGNHSAWKNEDDFNSKHIDSISQSSKESSQTSPPDIPPYQPQTKSNSLSRNKTAQQGRDTSVSTDNGFPISGSSKATAREKNRLAASKCRKRKKLEEKDLEEVRRSLKSQNTILLDTAANLREEVLFLKNEVLKHGMCEFSPIQNYITTTASQLHNCSPDIEECAD